MFQDPYPGYRHLRESDPVHYENGAGMWFLTRHEDCSTLLRSRDFSAALGQSHRRGGRALPVSMLNSDPPEHTRLREPAQRLFAAKEVERRSADLKRLVAERMPGAPAENAFDLLEEFAKPLAMSVLAETVAVPRHDLEWFGHCVVEASANLDPLAPSHLLERAHAAAKALLGYFAKLSRDGGEPTGLSILSPLAEECSDRGLSEEEYLNAVNLIVIGGYEPLTNLIANGVYTLLQFPGEMARLRAHPKLGPRAVDEILRYEPPVLVAARVPLRQVVIGDSTIAPGHPVVAFLGAANRDPAPFGDPESFVLTRDHNPHLSFGAGPHFCLGASLARATLQLAIEALLDRFGAIAPAGPVSWRPQLVPRGLVSLPVDVEPV